MERRPSEEAELARRLEHPTFMDLTTIFLPMRLASRFTEKRALAVTACWIAVLAITGSTDVLLFLAPALLIAIPLFAGRYFGEELIAKLVAKQVGRAPRRAPATLLPMPRPLAAWPPRGTRLIAFSLAKRPPPPLRLLTQT